MISFSQFLKEYGFTDMVQFMSQEDVSLPEIFDELKISKNDLPKVLQAGADYAAAFDKFIGIKKTIFLFSPTLKTKLNLLNNLYLLSRHPKKIKNYKALLEDIVELGKLLAMNPLAATSIATSAAMLIGTKNPEAYAIATKLLSSAYFYAETILKTLQNSKSEKIAELAMKAKVFLPKSEISH